MIFVQSSDVEAKRTPAHFALLPLHHRPYTKEDNQLPRKVQPTTPRQQQKNSLSFGKRSKRRQKERRPKSQREKKRQNPQNRPSLKELLRKQQQNPCPKGEKTCRCRSSQHLLGNNNKRKGRDEWQSPGRASNQEGPRNENSMTVR